MAQNIYRFKISLDYIKPVIWREIEVASDSTFYQFHLVIQEAMGWMNSHLHEFSDGSFRIGDTSEDACEWGEPADWDEKKKRLNQFFSEEKKKIKYVYDFGDDWRHTITLKSIKEKEDGVTYPRCINGARACPPEDCGSFFGYEHLLEILADPKHEEYEEMKEWSGDYDPEYFDKEEATEGMQNPLDLSDLF